MRHALGAALVAAALAVALPGAVASAQPAGRIALAGQTAWVRPDGPFQLRVDVDGVGAEAELEVAVTVHRVVRTRSQFQRTVDGEGLGRAVVAPTVEPLDDLRFGPGGAVVTVDLPRRLAPGVYPVSVALRDDDGEVADSFVTHLVRLPDEVPEIPLSVAWLQAVDAAPSVRPDGERRLDEDDLARLRTVAAAVGGAPETAVTLDVTPEVLEALEAAGEDEVVEALRRARSQGEVLATPYVELDVAAMVAAGRGDRIPEQRAAGEPVLRRLLGTTGEPRTWSIDDPIDARGLARLHAAGVSRVVVDESSLEPLDPSLTGGITLARPFAVPDGTGGTLEAASTDPGLLAHLEHDEPVLGAHHLLADLAVLWFDSPGMERGVVVRPAEGWVPDAELLGIVLRAFGNTVNPILRPVTVDALFTAVDPLTDDDDRVVQRPLDPGELGRLGVPGGALRDAGVAADAFAGLAGDDHELVPVLDQLLLVAEADALTAEERRRYLARVHLLVDEVRNDVRLSAGETFRLTAREGSIPVTFVNDNDFPVTATLVLASEKLEFPEADGGDRSRLVVRDIELEPGTTTRTVPVKVRTSGRFPVQGTLLDAEGRVELFRASYTVTSTVTSGIGVLLSVGAGVFLLLWWASHWRTVRRDRRLVEVSQ